MKRRSNLVRLRPGETIVAVAQIKGTWHVDKIMPSGQRRSVLMTKRESIARACAYGLAKFEGLTVIWPEGRRKGFAAIVTPGSLGKSAQVLELSGAQVVRIVATLSSIRDAEAMAERLTAGGVA